MHSFDDSHAGKSYKMSVGTNTDESHANKVQPTSTGPQPSPPSNLPPSLETTSSCTSTTSRCTSTTSPTSEGLPHGELVGSPVDSEGSTVSGGESIRAPSDVADDIQEELTDIFNTIADSIRHTLRTELDGYECEDFPELPDNPPDKHVYLMRDAGTLILEKNRARFEAMIEACMVTPRTAYPTFSRVVKELFKDGVINWGRIVVLVAFAGALSTYCVRQGYGELVPSIANWCTWFIQSRLGDWIRVNGGWDGFVKFFDQDDGQILDNAENQHNANLRWGIAFTVGAAGAAALSRVLTK